MNAKTRISNQKSEEKEEKKEKEEMKRKKRKGKEGFPIKDRKKAKKGKIGGKHNNSRSIKETRKENIRSSDQINVRRGK